MAYYSIKTEKHTETSVWLYTRNFVTLYILTKHNG